MDIEKLIERLKSKDFERDYDCTPFECGSFGLLDDAADALSTLQAENEKLRVELEQVKQERDEAVECVNTVYSYILIKSKTDAVLTIEKWLRGQKED